MISIHDVTMRFGRTAAVCGASLEIERGESLALWGTNGAGKTTLIRCVLGLLGFKGRIQVGGLDVRRQGKRTRRLVGYVPQELGFHDELGVAEAILYFARLKGVRGVHPAASLRMVGLCGHEAKRVRELSGGMKQRLALAIALLGDPPVLILDEVTASLDAVGRDEFVGLLRRLSGDGRTMLFASHRVEEVGALASRVALMSEGRVARVRPTAEFVGELRTDAVLHIEIAQAARVHAVRCLIESGLTPTLNGIGVLVPVSAGGKAVPVRLLTQAGIRVDNFELVSTAHAASLARHATEARP